jgi:N-acetylglutamate synthase-like GNAT family acetyltransferase
MLQIRKATEEDLEQLAAFVNAAYRGEGSKRGWTTEADILDGQRTDAGCLRSHIQGERQIILLFERAGNLHGCVYLRHETDHAYLGMLTVDPGLQNQGIGKQMLFLIEQWLKTHWRLNQVRMSVITLRTELISWYERRGYKMVSEKLPFPYGDVRFGKPKRDDLEFAILSKQLDL